MLFGTTEFGDTNKALFANVSDATSGTTGESWREYCLAQGKVEWKEYPEDKRNIIRCDDNEH